MIKIIEQEISFDDSLKKKLEFICDFCNTTPKFINGSISKIDKTNLSYIEPHRVIINDITFLAFNYSTEIYIKNLNYIDNVNDTNNDYKNMKRLSNTLNNVDKELKENRDIINTLTENNEALNLRLNTLTNKLTEKEKEIDNLTSDNNNNNNNLKAELSKWKNRFLKIINFIKNRLLRPKDKERYNEFTVDLYTHKAIDQEPFDDIRNNYSKDKRKDDFER